VKNAIGNLIGIALNVQSTLGNMVFFNNMDYSNPRSMYIFSSFCVIFNIFYQCLIVLGFASLSSVAQLCPTLCDPMNCSRPGLPVHHQLSEFTQTHVHSVGDAIQPSHPLLSPSPPALNPSQHQGLFK